MANKIKEVNVGQEILGWDFPEIETHERSRNWYIGASIITLLLVIFAIFTYNFLFAVIIIVGAMIIILNEKKEIANITFEIHSEGIIIGKRFYDYDDIKNFSIVYKPSFGVKKLYFEFKSPLSHRLTIPLLNINPLSIREILLKYLREDLDRTDEPNSEFLSKLFKI